MEPLLKVIDVHKWFDSNHVLKDVSFDVYRGEIISLLGPNGAGKSTLANILAGVYLPTKGKIIFKGKELKSNSPLKAHKKGIEIVYQNAGVISERTVSQNVFLGREKIRKLFKCINILDINFMKMETINLLNREMKLNISSVNLETKFCSGGERQAIGISRAFYFNADLIVMDEPTASLSVSARKVVYNFINELKNLNKGVIIISHEAERVYEISDKFIILSKGEKIGEFNKTELSMERLLKLMSA
jgi:simple sugar transport system ATP-binding protein